MIPASAKTLLDQPPSAVSIDELDRVVADCDAEVEAREAKLVDLQRQADRQAKQLADVKDGRAMLAQYRDFVMRVQGLPERTAVAGPSPPTAEDVDRKPSPRGAKPAAVEALLADGTAREKVEIGKHLIGLDLMADAKADWHSLDVLLSRMYRQGKLARPRPSVYQNPDALEASLDRLTENAQGGDE